MPTALITGGSAGLGRELALALDRQGWNLILDGRRVDRLAQLGTLIPSAHLIAGDVADPAHRRELVDRVAAVGGLDLLVNNASRLGPVPLPALADLDSEAFAGVLAVNTIAPAALTAALTAALVDRLGMARGIVLNLSSDAAVEHYPGWGGYGASKAALDHLTLTWAVERPEITFYAVDPGDMRTEMHQQAFPGQDIGDRPLPATVVPGLLALLAARPPSGRYRASEFVPVADRQRSTPAMSADEVEATVAS